MVEFLELYRPFLKGIEEKLLTESFKTLNPDAKLEFRPNKLGWLVSVSGVASSPHTIIEQNFWGQSIKYSVFAMWYYSRVITPSNAVQFVSNYDVTNGIYAMLYTPRPYKYFNKGSYITVIAPSVDPTTGLPIVLPTMVYAFLVNWIEITDLAEFKDSLKKINKGDF